jgi:hypothetical protein
LDILAYILSFLGTVSIIASCLVKGKNMKVILSLVFAANVFVAVGYLVGGDGINGAISCFIGAAQAFINYFFERKNKSVPIWLIVIYCVAFAAFNLACGFSIPCLVAILASMTFVMCIGQKSGAKYRFWTIFNIVLWCLFDVLSHAYPALLMTHIPQLLFTVLGILIYDRKRN